MRNTGRQPRVGELPPRIARAQAIIAYRAEKSPENADNLVKHAVELHELNKDRFEWSHLEFQYEKFYEKMFADYGVPVKLQAWVSTARKFDPRSSHTIVPKDPEDMIFLTKLLPEWVNDSSIIDPHYELSRDWGYASERNKENI